MKKEKPKFWKWGLIHLAILLSLVVLIQSLNNTKTLTIKTTYVNLYKKPKLNAKITNQLTYNSTATISQETKYWYQVTSPSGQEGWIQKSQITSQKIKEPFSTPMVTIKKTPLLANYTTNSTVIKYFKKATPVTILDYKANLALVKINNTFGWIEQNNLKGTDKTPLKLINKQVQKNNIKIYAKKKNLAIKNKANAKAKIITTVDAGATLTKLDQIHGWFKVKTNDNKIGYVPSYEVTTTNLKVAEKPSSNKLKGAVIVLDAGHGGQDPGSVSNDHRYEKDATLATVKTIAKALKDKGAKVILTRSDDTFVSLSKRPQISNENKADAFIGIHYDSTESKNIASGTTTYYYHENSKALADDLNTQIANTLPLPNKGVMFGDHQITRDNERPAVLLELGYLSNDKDAKLAFSKEYQEQVATAITNGLENYLAQAKKES